MSIILNKEQQEAADKIKGFLKDPNTKGTFFTLTGGPGTGKTFMLREAIKDYRGTIYGATVSHAAKNVLQQSIGVNVSCFTIAQLLGMKMHIDDVGNIKFVPAKYVRKSIQDANIVIVDEVSMIDDGIFNMLLREIIANDIRLIAVGDKYQLPPVEQEHDSRFFDTIDAELIRPMRFSGAIQSLSELYKAQVSNINNGEYFDKWILNTATQREDNMDEHDVGYGFTNDIFSVIRDVAHDIKTNPDDMNYARILAYKNDSVKALNEAVRKLVYDSDNLSQFEHNEIVICNGGYTYPFRDLNGVRKVSILYNGQILRVEGWKEVAEGPFGIPCLMMKFKDLDVVGGHPIYVVQETEQASTKYHTIKTQLKQNAEKDSRQWQKFYHFIDSFAYFDYCYAQNLYKAQGATLNNVYVCEGEVMGVKPLNWKQKFQALYVATTRARQKLIIQNKDF
jgi:hypothetical protein